MNTPSRPHLGTHGVCAPSNIAGDQRAMVSRPYATIAHILVSQVQKVQLTLAPLRDNTSAGEAAYVVGSAGLGERGSDCGIADTLTRAETSFFTEGYPFRDFEFMLRGLAIVPDGMPFRAASVSNSGVTVSIGGDAATRVPSIHQGACSEIADSVVSAFFQSMSLQLGFKSESAKWDVATPLFHPGGLGLTGSSTPTNASPIGGKVLTLPFDVQLPRANHRGVSVAQLLFRQEQEVTVVASGARATADYVTAFAADSGTDSKALVQKFKVILIGEKTCAADSFDARLQRLAAQYGCTVDQARAIAGEVSRAA